MTLPRFQLAHGRQGALLAVAISGLITLVLGLLIAPERAWPNLLISDLYLTGIGLGASLFIATQYVSSAGWSVAIRRIPEAMMSILPIAGIGSIALFCGMHRLYEWSRDRTRDGVPGVGRGGGVVAPGSWQKAGRGGPG